MAMAIKVLIADDHQIMREGLRTMLEKDPDMEVMGEAEDGRTLMKMLRELTPDVIIMDVTMPDLNGIEATRHITHEFPAVKVIALSMHDNRRFVINMLKSGASGYLIKDCAFRELADAIRLVVTKNKTFLSPGITDVVVNHYVTGPALDSLVYAILTPREREVLQLIAEGKTSKQIAECLYVSVKTVECHRHQLMQKLGKRNVAELTKFAIREGIIAV
jgi:two-component system response regulator NreC